LPVRSPITCLNYRFGDPHTHPLGSIYLIGRYYDPTTGQFLSADPDVAQTRQSYIYSDDNPSNEADPNGLDSEGYCGVISLSLLGAAGWGSLCIVEVNGNAQVGVTFTGGGGSGLNLGSITKNLSSNAFKVANFISTTGGIAYEASNANTVAQLGNWFFSANASVCFAPFCGFANYFTNYSGIIHGHLIGFGYGARATGSMSLIR